jgi:hypothetical protein
MMIAGGHDFFAFVRSSALFDVMSALEMIANGEAHI